MQKTAELSISSRKRTEFISVTRQVADIANRHSWQDGILTLFIPHTTAGVTINENADPDVVLDMENFCNTLVPQSPKFQHSEGNSDAHIKASFYGSSVQVIIRSGKLWLGVWQGIYFCEFDGPRQRNIYLAFSNE